MKIFKSLILLLLVSSSVFAQNDKKAVDYLDQVTEKTNSYNDMEFQFSYRMYNPAEGIDEPRGGYAYIKKDKFRLKIDDITIIYDGKKRYSIVDDEVTISSQNDASGISSPMDILNLYKEGYVIKWDIEQKNQSTTVQFVKLIPIDSESQYKYILIGVDKNSVNLNQVIYADSQGTEFRIEIKNLKINQNLDDAYFQFNKADYPEDEYLYTDLDE